MEKQKHAATCRLLAEKTIEADQQSNRLATLEDASGAAHLLVENIELSERIQEMEERLANEQLDQLGEIEKEIMLEAAGARVSKV